MEPRRDIRPAPAYRLLLALFALPLLGYTAWQALRERSLRYLRERYGFHRAASPATPLWLHAASVGELNAALPLLAALREHHPALPLLVTTATPSSARLAARKLPSQVPHAFLPLDFAGAVDRFLDRVTPRCAVVMETELWPNLFAACARRTLPLVIVNGRLSRRTLHAPPWMRRLYCDALTHASAILARSDADRDGFLALGAAAEKVRVIGNIKFSAVGGTVLPAVALPRPYVLAASTRDGEEQRVFEAWRMAEHGGRLLVIVPRHPKRLAAILKALPRTGVAVRSRGETIGEDTAIYVADTFGELTGFIAGAELVFMGGSLVAKGGQNVLEPAALGKAIVFGPHMENFADEARLLLAHDGALQVADATALGDTLTALLHTPERRAQLGANARGVVEQRRDVAQRYADALIAWCGP